MLAMQVATMHARTEIWIFTIWLLLSASGLIRTRRRSRRVLVRTPTRWPQSPDTALDAPGGRMFRGPQHGESGG